MYKLKQINNLQWYISRRSSVASVLYPPRLSRLNNYDFKKLYGLID